MLAPSARVQQTLGSAPGRSPRHAGYWPHCTRGSARGSEALAEETLPDAVGGEPASAAHRRGASGNQQNRPRGIASGRHVRIALSSSRAAVYQPMGL